MCLFFFFFFFLHPHYAVHPEMMNKRLRNIIIPETTDKTDSTVTYITCIQYMLNTASRRGLPVGEGGRGGGGGGGGRRC